jgi:hypothetical protein
MRNKASNLEDVTPVAIAGKLPYINSLDGKEKIAEKKNNNTRPGS